MEQENRKKYTSPAIALQQIQRYCAYQDRCHSEVRTKLLSMGVYGDTLEEIMASLVEDKFLDEERFARSFARGKFRFKQWGRRRIVMELKQRQISEYCIRKALEEIHEDEYHQTLSSLLHKKLPAESLPDYNARFKAANYAIQRGFEQDLVWACINAMLTSAS